MDTTTKRGEPVIKLEGHRWCAIEEWCERGGREGGDSSIFQGLRTAAAAASLLHGGGCKRVRVCATSVACWGNRGNRFSRRTRDTIRTKKAHAQKKISHRRRQRSTAPASDNSQYTHTNIAQTRNRVKIAAPEIITLKYNLDRRGEKKYA